MSKEKNLTYLYKDGVVPTVVTKGHQIVDEIAFSETLIQNYTRPANGKHLQGPAIDRLYEFEKLGMEPEEIGHLKSENNLLADVNENLSTQYLRLFGNRDELKNEVESLNEKIEYWKTENQKLKDENEQLKKDLAWYKGQNKVLKTQHSNQADSIRNLMDDNEELRQQIKFLEETVEKFGVEESKQKIDELIKECAERERNVERLHEVIKNQNELIDELKGNSIPGLTCKQVISQQRERINDLKGRLKRKTDEYNEKIMAMSVDMDKLQEEIETLKKDRDAYKETAEMYREKCISLETKPLTVEEYEEYLEKLAKKYNLVAFKSADIGVHSVIFTDSKPLFSDRHVVFEVYIYPQRFNGSKDIMKTTENNLRKKLHLLPLEDDRA